MQSDEASPNKEARGFLFLKRKSPASGGKAAFLSSFIPKSDLGYSEMRNKQYQLRLLVSPILWIVLSVLLFLGGLGYARSLVIALGGVVSVLFLIYSHASKKGLSFPRGFQTYLLFLVLFGVTLIWSLDWQKSFLYLVLFVSGGIFWVAFFNLQKELRSSIEKLVLVLGVLLGIFALAYKYFGFAPLQMVYFNLIFPATENHHHIGDFWALVLVFVIYQVLFRKKYIFSLFFIPGIYFLLLSLSRAAYVSLAAGALSIFYFKGLSKNYRLYLFLVFILVSALFIFAGALKTTLLSRPYFLQALVGIVKYPFGVGYGNLGLLSSELPRFLRENLANIASFSSLAHNIVLEVLVGMGILGFSFIYWLYKISKNLFIDIDKKNIVFVASFFALLTNFFFDFTYTIPTMFYLWFIFLGLAQKEKFELKWGILTVYIMIAFLIISGLLISFGILKPNLLR